MNKILAGLFFLSVVASGASPRILTADFIEGVQAPKNYIKNGQAESPLLTKGWATYADGANSKPVDATGGAPTTTWTTTSSSALRGNNSFLYTHTAANLQGEGASYAFTIDSADQAKVLTVSFDYAIASGTYSGGTSSTDSDLEVYVYDVTNSTVIQPAGYKLSGAVSGTQYKGVATFQTASNSTNYRLAFHNPNTTATAFSVKFDNIVTGPMSAQYGAPVTDWVTYTLGITGSTSNPTKGTVANDFAQWRRVGDTMEIRYEYRQTVAGTAGSGTYLFALPAGYTIDTNKVATISGGFNGMGAFGSASAYDGTSVYAGTIVPGDSTHLIMQVGSVSAVGGNIASGVIPLSTTALRYGFYAKVPITGWSSTVQMSSDTDTRVVAMSATGSATAIAASNGVYDVVWTTTQTDTHGAFNGTTYTIPVAGWYTVSSNLKVNTSTAVAGDSDSLNILKNGTAFATGQVYRAAAQTSGFPQVTKTQLFAAGDLVKVQIQVQFNSGTAAISGTALNNQFSISRVGGPSAITATESVNARYYATATTLTSSLTNITYTTKDFDSHNAYSAGTYTIPVSGKYQVNAAVGMSATYAAGNTNAFAILKNGSIVSQETRLAGSSSETTIPGHVNDIISCNAGDTITIQGSSAGTSPSYVSGNIRNFFSISRVGN